MARRRPSSGSYGIAIDSNPRVGPPPSAPRNSNSRNRLIPQSDASSVERWLTSPTIPTDRKHSSRSSSQKKKLQDAQTKSAIPLIHSHKPAQRVTRGQRLLHERIATTCSDSFAATKQPNPPKRQQRKLEESQQVSRIFKQRQGKRFTFEEECDQQVPAVETDDSLNPSEEDDQHQILNRSRPGMTSPGVNYHRNHQSTHHVPPPPAPSHPARPHRPTHATPVAVSIPPTHKNTQNTTSRKTKTIIPFVKRHTLAVAKKDDEFGSDETTQEPAQRRCSTSPGSQGIRPKLQQSLFQDDSISVSSSVTRPIDPVSNSLDRHLVPNHQRANSNLSHGTSKSDSLSSGTEANRSTVSNNNLARKTVQSRQFRFPSMRDLVSLGSEGISHSESKRTISLNNKSSGSSKTKSSGGKPFDFKKTAKAGSPNSCSITAATSGTVMSTPTNDSQDEEISQLTFPESHATQQTNGIHSNAETEKVQNISRRGDGMRSIKVHPNAAPKRLSLHIRQQSDEEREKEDVDSRGSSKNTTSPDNPTETLNATETVSAMTELLRKTNRIKLHVYDLVENDTQLDLFGCYFPLGQCFNALNSSLHSMGTGAYHVGIEVSTGFGRDF